ncbi:MAG: chloride channel protein [Lysobacterales bacterium]|jgi:H+/Cl- antiporter ClcA
MAKLLEKTLIRVTLYGATTGLVAGVVVLAFRWLIESGQATFLPGGAVGNYEALSPGIRLVLPAVSGLVLGLLFERLPVAMRDVGVVHVLANLRSAAGGRLPIRNALVQFFFGAAALISGQSVDREGPGVHLGSTCGSALGEHTGLSHRDRRTLIACGAAASVAAAFNTPLAGAIFGIEVLRFRYNIARFMPVIMAAVIGAVVVRVVRGPAPSFLVPKLGMQSVVELPVIALLGLATGLVAGAFTFACERFTLRFLGVRPLLGFTAAGLLTGILAQAVPQIMGVGSDALAAMMTTGIAAPLLLGIVVCKVLATSVAIGFRMPGGLIGPTLVIGGAMGSLVHFVFGFVLPGEMASPGFYAIIGMVAMMGATLHAPLAALIALLELTATPNIILPGMLAVVASDIMYRLLMGRESVFVGVLRALKSGEHGQTRRGN